VTPPTRSTGGSSETPSGGPQGTLHEGAVKLVEKFAPPDTADDCEKGLVRGQQELLSYGITGWQDAIVTPEIQEAYLSVCRRRPVDSEGEAVGALWWDRARGMEQIDELIERRAMGGDCFSPTSVKLMLDGVAENFTASMVDPWLGPDGAPTDNRGVDFIDPTELREIVTRLDALGFQCHFHTIGDRAVRNALDAVETARGVNGPNDNRHHLAHIQVVHPTDIPRFAMLEAVANAQPLWACHEVYQDELTIPFLGEARASWQYPFASLLSSGARMGMGSDWGVSTANVMEEVDMAVTRTSDDGRPFYPEECLTLEQSLTAFTSGSAYINHAEHDAGMLAVGMLADLVVLDRDPFESGPIRDAKVALTMIGGEVVYEE
jgi:predicted amidohydrolase YtcJ